MEGINLALERYFRILEGEERAGYLVLKERGKMKEKVDRAEEIVQNCGFCERNCFANRKEGEMGHCGVGYESRVSSAFVHTGEESYLVPSGTIFFSGCNLHCKYCQNWGISQNPKAGIVWKPEDIAEWIEGADAINCNLVGGEPTPNLHNIMKALSICERNIPIVWNSNMYMSVPAMGLLEGVVDVYLSDFKYGNNECAERLSVVSNYFDVVSRNHKLASEHAEVVIRHLVLPGHVECCSKNILEWIAENLGVNVRVNLMSQYRPAYRARDIEEINRKVTGEEFGKAVEIADRLGLNYEAQRF